MTAKTQGYLHFYDLHQFEIHLALLGRAESPHFYAVCAIMPSSWHCWEQRITAFLRGLLNGLLGIAVRGSITAFICVVCARGIAGKAESQHFDIAFEEKQN